MQTLTRYEPNTLSEAVSLADRLSKSGLVPNDLRGKPDDILVILMSGAELGLAPMQALRGLAVINGRPVISADLAVSLVKRHPSCVSFRLVASTPTGATYATERQGEGVTQMIYTWEQATAAGLTGRGPWKQHPAAMLRARCALALARAVYPDALLGVYSPDEGEDIAASLPAPTQDAAPVAVVDVTPAPAALATVDATPTPAPEDALVAELVAAVHAANTLRDLRATGARIAASKLGNRPGLRDAYASRQRDLHQKRG